MLGAFCVVMKSPTAAPTRLRLKRRLGCSERAASGGASSIVSAANSDSAVLISAADSKDSISSTIFSSSASCLETTCESDEALLLELPPPEAPLEELPEVLPEELP